jgi:hypothetical protein
MFYINVIVTPSPPEPVLPDNLALAASDTVLAVPFSEIKGAPNLLYSE